MQVTGADRGMGQAVAGVLVVVQRRYVALHHGLYKMAAEDRRVFPVPEVASVRCRSD